MQHSRARVIHGSTGWSPDSKASTMIATLSLKPGKMNGHKKRTLSGANADWLRQRIRSGPFTLRKLTAELAERGVKTDPRAVWVFVHAEGLSFKKNKPARRAR